MHFRTHFKLHCRMHFRIHFRTRFRMYFRMRLNAIYVHSTTLKFSYINSRGGSASIEDGK